ncbi:MAG TPA: hypothetical protein VGX76_25345, partial [Pirellulales bacterium]|nr:hypothetical protein [Pirellulales bacterium]
KQVVFSPDARRIVTLRGRQISLLDTATQKPIFEPWQLAADVATTRFSGDSSRLLVITALDVWVWDLASGQAVSLSAEGQRGTVEYAQFSPDGNRILTRALMGTAVRVWDAATGKLTALLEHFNIVWCAVFSPDSSHVATGCNDILGNTVRIWDAATGQLAFEPLKHGIGALDVEYSPDGRQLVSASKDRTAQVWDAAAGAAFGAPLEHSGIVHKSVFSPDGTRVATASADQTARIWDVATSKAITPPLLHQGSVDGIAFSPDGRRLLTAADDQTARVWDAAGGRPIQPPLPHDERLRPAAFSPDGSQIVTRSTAGNRVWDISGEQAETNDSVDGGSFLFSSDGRCLLATVPGEKIATSAMRGLETATGNPLAARVEHDSSLVPVAVSPDARRVVMITMDEQNKIAQAEVWDLTTGRRAVVAIEPSRQVLQFAFSLDSSRVVATSCARPSVPQPEVPPVTDGAASLVQTSRAQMYSAITGEAIGPSLEHEVAVGQALFSPDGGQVATVGSDKAVRLWDALTGRLMTPPLEHNDDIRQVVYRWDGRRLLTACTGFERAEARIWDAATGESVVPPMKHAKTIQQASFSPDGSRVVTASRDKTARIWDAATGQPVSPPLQQKDEVLFARFSPDGRLVVTADDLTLRVWDAATGRPVTPLQYHDRLRPSDSVEHELIDSTMVARRDGQTGDDRDEDDAGPNNLAHEPPSGDVSFGYGSLIQPLDDLTSERRPHNLRHVGFSADSQHVITYSLRPHENGARTSLDRTLWNFAEDSRVVTDLALLTQLLTEHRLDAVGALARLPSKTIQDAWQSLSSKYPREFSPPQRVLAWHKSEAEQAADAEQWFAAIFHLGCLIDVEPSNGSHYLRRGQAYANAGDWNRAAADVSKAIELNADVLIAWRLLGWVHYCQGQFQQAIGDYTKAIGLAGGDGWTWRARGAAYAELAHWNEAATDFARSAELDADPQILVNRAFALAGTADAASYNQARAVLVEQYRRQEVFAVLERPTLLGAQAEPGASALWAVIAQPADGIDPDEVARMAQVMVLLRKSPASLTTFGAALYRAGQFAESIENLNSAIEASYGEAATLERLFLAMAHSRLGHSQEARQCLGKAVSELDPRDAAGAGDGATWSRRLLFKLVRREAEELVNAKP